MLTKISASTIAMKMRMIEEGGGGDYTIEYLTLKPGFKGNFPENSRQISHRFYRTYYTYTNILTKWFIKSRSHNFKIHRIFKFQMLDLSPRGNPETLCETSTPQISDRNITQWKGRLLISY